MYPRHAGESLMATMPQSHPWRYRDAAELQAAASSFEYADSILRLTPITLILILTLNPDP